MPYGITLNAIVSALATASKASLLCAVADSIGQLKWSWFQQPRNLYDLQAFDEASRGPAGAVALLFGRSKGVLVTIGAVITVLSLVFDPFVQQILRYPDRDVVSLRGTAQTRKASSFPTDWSSTELSAAINAGIWSGAAQFDRAPHCSSGNCHWDVFDSFGWCSECSDATSQANLIGHCDFANWSENSTCRLTFGRGNSVVVAHGVPGGLLTGLSLTSEVTWSLGWTVDNPYDDYYLHSSDYANWFNLTYLGVQNPTVSMGYASFDAQGPCSHCDPTPVPSIKLLRAEQCVLTPCVKTYNTSTRGGTLQLKTVSTNYGITKFVNVRGGALDLEDFVDTVACWQPDRRDVEYAKFYVNPATGGSCNNAYQCDWWNASENAFCPIFSYGNKIETSLNSTTREQYSYEPAGEAGWSSNGPFNTSDIIRQVAHHNLSYIMSNVAASLTNLALDLSGELFMGRVTINETYVVVRWEWFILPIVLEAAGAFLCLATVFRVHKRKTVLWQSSLLPLLFGGMDEQGTQIGPPTKLSLSDMESKAKQTLGQLNTGGSRDAAMPIQVSD